MTYLFFFSLFLLFCSWIIPSKPKIESYKIPEGNKEIKNLIASIIQWSEVNIIMGKKRKIRPLVTISNSRNTKYCGTYDPLNKTIVIYIKNNPDVLTLIDTCIHEYIHHLQLRGINDNSRYNKLTKSKGYWENDYEIEVLKPQKTIWSAETKEMLLEINGKQLIVRQYEDDNGSEMWVRIGDGELVEVHKLEDKNLLEIIKSCASNISCDLFDIEGEFDSAELDDL